MDSMQLPQGQGCHMASWEIPEVNGRILQQAILDDPEASNFTIVSHVHPIKWDDLITVMAIYQL